MYEDLRFWSITMDDATCPSLIDFFIFQEFFFVEKILEYCADKDKYRVKWQGSS